MFGQSEWAIPALSRPRAHRYSHKRVHLPWSWVQHAWSEDLMRMFDSMQDAYGRQPKAAQTAGRDQPAAESCASNHINFKFTKTSNSAEKTAEQSHTLLPHGWGHATVGNTSRIRDALLACLTRNDKTTCILDSFGFFGFFQRPVASRTLIASKMLQSMPSAQPSIWKRQSESKTASKGTSWDTI